MVDVNQRLYWEAHITIIPVEDDNMVTVLKVDAEKHGFRIAKLIMIDQGLEPASFMTARDDNGHLLFERTSAFIGCLLDDGFVVKRYKIESTGVDSRIEDVLGVISK